MSMVASASEGMTLDLKPPLRMVGTAEVVEHGVELRLLAVERGLGLGVVERAVEGGSVGRGDGGEIREEGAGGLVEAHGVSHSPTRATARARWTIALSRTGTDAWPLVPWRGG